MKNLLPILALLLLAGCTSEPTTPTELERCIEVNEVKNNFVEKYDDFLVQRNSSKDIGSEEFSVFMETLNRVEEEIRVCRSIPADELDEIFPGYKEWSPEERITKERYQSWWAERSQTCDSEIKAKEVERVTNLCHAQGIY